MKKMIYYVDLHGVLVNTHKMIKNYEQVLTNIYVNYGIPFEKAVRYHNLGLKQFSSHIKSVVSKNLIGKDFLSEMDRGDKEWDKLMQSFIPDHDAIELESRNIEFLAGSISDTFYTDAKQLILEMIIKSEENPLFDFFIVSNSHSSHIHGLLTGAGFNDLKKDKFLGWDKMECLKSNEKYYTRLESFCQSSDKVLIGNSKNEMVLGKKSGFKTIFITREFSGENNFENSIDLQYNDLETLRETI